MFHIPGISAPARPAEAREAELPSVPPASTPMSTPSSILSSLLPSPATQPDRTSLPPAARPTFPEYMGPSTPLDSRSAHIALDRVRDEARGQRRGSTERRARGGVAQDEQEIIVAISPFVCSREKCKSATSVDLDDIPAPESVIFKDEATLRELIEVLKENKCIYEITVKRNSKAELLTTITQGLHKHLDDTPSLDFPGEFPTSCTVRNIPWCPQVLKPLHENGGFPYYLDHVSTDSRGLHHPTNKAQYDLKALRDWGYDLGGKLVIVISPKQGNIRGSVEHFPTGHGDYWDYRSLRTERMHHACYAHRLFTCRRLRDVWQRDGIPETILKCGTEWEEDMDHPDRCCPCEPHETSEDEEDVLMGEVNEGDEEDEDYAELYNGDDEEEEWQDEGPVTSSPYRPADLQFIQEVSFGRQEDAFLTETAENHRITETPEYLLNAPQIPVGNPKFSERLEARLSRIQFLGEGFITIKGNSAEAIASAMEILLTQAIVYCMNNKDSIAPLRPQLPPGVDVSGPWWLLNSWGGCFVQIARPGTIARFASGEGPTLDCLKIVMQRLVHRDFRLLPGDSVFHMAAFTVSPRPDGVECVRNAMFGVVLALGLLKSSGNFEVGDVNPVLLMFLWAEPPKVEKEKKKAKKKDDKKDEVVDLTMDDGPMDLTTDNAPQSATDNVPEGATDNATESATDNTTESATDDAPESAKVSDDHLPDPKPAKYIVSKPLTPADIVSKSLTGAILHWLDPALERHNRPWLVTRPLHSPFGIAETVVAKASTPIAEFVVETMPGSVIELPELNDRSEAQYDLHHKIVIQTMLLGSANALDRTGFLAMQWGFLMYAGNGLLKPEEIVGTVCQLYNRHIESMDDVRKVLSILKYDGGDKARQPGQQHGRLTIFSTTILKDAISRYLEANGDKNLAISRTKALLSATNGNELIPLKNVEILLVETTKTMPPLTFKVNTCYNRITLAYDDHLRNLTWPRVGITVLDEPYWHLPTGSQLTFEKWWEHQIEMAIEDAKKGIYTDE